MILQEKAWQLIRMYETLREEYGFKHSQFTRVKDESTQFSCFLKLAFILEEYKCQGLVIDPVDWLRAHFEYYKKAKRFYPTHLITSFSFKLYNRYIAEQVARETTMKATLLLEQEEELLDYLARARRQTEEQVLLDVYQEEVFSREFLLQNLTFQNLLETGRVEETRINMG